MSDRNRFCQHCQTDISELSKRSKQCHACRDMKAEAHRYKHYDLTMGAMTRLSHSEHGTGEAWRAAVRQRVAAGRSHRSQRKDEERREREARRERNALLRSKGYYWVKEDEESMDGFGATAFQSVYGSRGEAWVLKRRDHAHAVDVDTALAEIAAGTNPRYDAQRGEWFNPQEGARD